MEQWRGRRGLRRGTPGISTELAYREKLTSSTRHSDQVDVWVNYDYTPASLPKDIKNYGLLLTSIDRRRTPDTQEGCLRLQCCTLNLGGSSTIRPPLALSRAQLLTTKNHGLLPVSKYDICSGLQVKTQRCEETLGVLSLMQVLGSPFLSSAIGRQSITFALSNH